MIFADLVARLKADSAIVAIAGQRVYPAPAPEAAALPNVTWQQIGDGSTRVSSGMLNVRQTRVQVNVWADDRLEAINLEAAVRASLDSWRLTGNVFMAMVVNVVDLIDTSFNPVRYGRGIDVQIVHKEV